MTIQSHIWLLGAILGLCAVTFATRSFFLLTPAKFQFPPLIQRALRYAPTAAIMAVIAPSILMPEHHLDLSWHNSTLIATLVASFVFVKKQNLLLMIAVGMAIFTFLRLV